MSSTQISLSIEGSHADITFHTETGVNVLASNVLRSLKDVVETVSRNKAVRTTAIRATGKVFLAGADIKEMASFSSGEAQDYARLGQGTLDALEALPCITVAAIHGATLGGGLELALACDFRIAVKSAKMGLPETSLGLIPGWSGIRRLSGLVGGAKAKRLFYGAKPISAEEGFAIGLVDEVVDSVDDLGAQVSSFCRSLNRGAPQAVALAKRAFYDGDDVGAFGACFETEDGREGIAAFIEKRSAKWME